MVETLAQLEREGLPSDKQLKQLKKIGSFGISKTEVGKYYVFFFNGSYGKFRSCIFFSKMKFLSFWNQKAVAKWFEM